MGYCVVEPLGNHDCPKAAPWGRSNWELGELSHVPLLLPRNAIKEKNLRGFIGFQGSSKVPPRFIPRFNPRHLQACQHFNTRGSCQTRQKSAGQQSIESPGLTRYVRPISSKISLSTRLDTESHQKSRDNGPNRKDSCGILAVQLGLNVIVPQNHTLGMAWLVI